MKNISLKLDESGDIFLNVKSIKQKKCASINLNHFAKKIAPIARDTLIG